MVEISKKISYYLPGIISCIFFVILLFTVLHITSIPKTPATAEQVWDVMVSKGHEPEDVTEKYTEISSILMKCIRFQEDDVHFEFFVLNNQESAIKVWRELYYLSQEKMGWPRSEHDTVMANYHIYTLTETEKFFAVIRVGNTAVYAHCDKENISKISEILKDIEYFS